MPIIYGFLAGILSGFGMGGGTILILCLTTLEGLEQHVAQATNLVFFLPASIAAILTNRKKFKIKKKLVGTIVIFGVIGAILRSKFITPFRSWKIKKSICSILIFDCNQ